jgi:3-dehydroquinate synthase
LDPTASKNLQIFRGVGRISKYVLITDSNVASLHLHCLTAYLKALDVQVHSIIFSAGERSKCFQTYRSLLRQCSHIFDKESSVISFGGGVAKELAGFIASTLFRGLNPIHIPTTVLAQVDAAIECNQSLNLPHGKNTSRDIVLAVRDLDQHTFLRTLPERWIRHGLAESIKYALCHSPAFLIFLVRLGCGILLCWKRSWM